MSPSLRPSHLSPCTYIRLTAPLRQAYNYLDRSGGGFKGTASNDSHSSSNDETPLPGEERLKTPGQADSDAPHSAGRPGSGPERERGGGDADAEAAFSRPPLHPAAPPPAVPQPPPAVLQPPAHMGGTASGGHHAARGDPGGGERSRLFDPTQASAMRRSRDADPLTAEVTDARLPEAAPVLTFESRFESGNLLKASRVGDLEYDLMLRSDHNTGGTKHPHATRIY